MSSRSSKKGGEMLMSTSASITWTIHKYNAQTKWVDIIKLLLSNGWSLNDQNQMTFLPLNDNDMFAWQREPINEEKLFKLLSNKEKLKEPLGVCITWKDTNIGGSLLTINGNQLLFSITINRRIIPLCGGGCITDINWYLLRINSILLQKKDVIVEATTFDEML